MMGLILEVREEQEKDLRAAGDAMLYKHFKLTHVQLWHVHSHVHCNMQ